MRSKQTKLQTSTGPNLRVWLGNPSHVESAKKLPHYLSVLKSSCNQTIMASPVSLTTLVKLSFGDTNRTVTISTNDLEVRLRITLYYMYVQSSPVHYISPVHDCGRTLL